MGENEVKAGGFVATAGRADPLAWEAIKEHRSTFLAPSPILLFSIRRFLSSSVREDEDEPSCLMATAGRADPLAWVAIKEHRFTFLAESPI